MKYFVLGATYVIRLDAGEKIVETLKALCERDAIGGGFFNGLGAVGYSTSDIPALVEGTLPQHRVTKLSPRPATPESLARLFEEAMRAW